MKRTRGTPLLAILTATLLIGVLSVMPNGLREASASSGSGTFLVQNYATGEGTGGFFMRGYIFEVSQETIVTGLTGAGTNSATFVVALYEATSTATKTGALYDGGSATPTKLLGDITFSLGEANGSNVTKALSSPVTLEPDKLYLLAQMRTAVIIGSPAGAHVTVTGLDRNNILTHPRIAAWGPTTGVYRWDAAFNSSTFVSQASGDINEILPRLGLQFVSDCLLPSVRTDSVLVTGTDIVFNGTLLGTGANPPGCPAPEIELAFEVGTVPDLSVSGSFENATPSKTSSPGSFAYTFSDATAGTTYFFRAVAINEAGRDEGSVVSFTFTPQPSIQDALATDVSDRAATVSAVMVSAGTSPVTSRGFCLTPPGGAEDCSAALVDPPHNSGTFSALLSGLSPASAYEVRAFATNGSGTTFSDPVGFTTLATPPAEPPAAPPIPAASPVTDPGGGVPAVSPGVTTGSVGGVPVAPAPSRPNAGAAEFRVGTVETRVDVASSGAGRVAGSGSAPVIQAVRDRVATVSGGGMQAGGIAEVWLPLPNGGSRQVALLPIGPDGTFDGALPFTGELDGRGPLPIGDRTIQLYGVGADGKLTVINFSVRIEQPAPLAPEPDRGRGAVPTLAPGQSLATNAGVPTPVTVTPLPDARSTRIEGDGWLMDVDVPDGKVRAEGGAPLIEIVNGTDSVVRGTGFMAGTRAYVWLMSDPTFLGEVTVRADGTFFGSVPIAGVAPGEHTLQLSGVGTDGFVRAANLGVVLVGDGMPRPTRVPAGEGPLQVPGGALLWLVGLSGVALVARGRVARQGR